MNKAMSCIEKRSIFYMNRNGDMILIPKDSITYKMVMPQICSRQDTYTPSGFEFVIPQKNADDIFVSVIMCDSMILVKVYPKK